MIRIKKFNKRLFEDDQQNGQTPQGSTPQANSGQTPSTGQAQNGQTPQGSTPQANGQQAGQSEQGNQIDYKAAVINTHKFIGTIMIKVQAEIQQGLKQGCPELDAMGNDQNSPYKDGITKVNEAYKKLTLIKINPENVDTIAASITNFAEFMNNLAALAKEISEKATNEQEQQGQNGQASTPQNGQTPQAGETPQNNGEASPNPQQNNVNASYNYDSFGTLLNEKMTVNQHLRNIGQYWK